MTKKIPILMYHEIYRPEERDRLRGLTNPVYNTEINVFQKQMAYLYAKRMKTLTIDELFLKESSSPGEGAVCLTFDDGWRGNYLHAYPVLQEYGLKATFFIATDLIGKPFYMTWEDIKGMAVSGMSIQSHTVTHRPLAHMGGERVLFELSESKRVIEERLGQEVRHLSLPHGSKNGMTWPIAKGIGYKSICTSDVGFQTPEDNGPWLKRINMGDGLSEKKFQLIIHGKNQAIWDMMVTKGLKNMLRGIVGTKNYRKLYKRIYAKKG
jgi:peptidoglycan/xylan/chitin deacetylase (PgdA/CDA1 family)